MTQTQKFLKGIQNMANYPQPKAKVAKRIKRRGSEYRTRMDLLSATHEAKRLQLLQIRAHARQELPIGKRRES